MTSTAFIRFIPFYGILDEQYLCYLLDIDDFYIVIFHNFFLKKKNIKIKNIKFFK